MESCTVILFFGVDLLPDVPIFPVKVRDQSAETDEKYNLGIVPEED